MARSHWVARWARRAHVARKLPAAQWRAAWTALGWTVVTRVGLFALPWRRVHRFFEEIPVEGSPDWDRALRFLWAVNAVARRLLRDRPCLTQALVGQRLLRRCGIDSDLRIGVARIDGEFRAHAWLERDGRVLLGGASSPRQYTVLKQGMAGATL